MRSEPWRGWAALGRGRGVRLLVQGDGRTYKLTLKPDDAWDGVAWQADFATAPLATAGAGGGRVAGSGSGGDGSSDGSGDGDWQVVDLPFEAFLPNLRGRVVAGAPPLAPRAVRQVGLMVSKFASAGGMVEGFREGDFSLAVRAIRVIP